MKSKTNAAMTFLALAGLLGAATAQVQAQDDDMRQDGKGNHGMRFERADADQSGDLTFEEYAATIDARLANADTDGDGRMTVGEIADEIVRIRAERQARRLVRRFDVNGDGALTADEIENRQRKMFALLDRNDDGMVDRSEMPRRGKGHHRRHRPQ
ncbi:MAG: acid-shock protein [Nitratireductor sp.]|nr:acid-shock protein [Nitratireductor arenosus]